MKQKIVVKVSMTCDECRRKALQTVSKIKGLISVAIEGPEKDRVVLVGEDIDTVRLLGKLRKKVGKSDIVNVQEIKPPAPEPKPKPEPVPEPKPKPEPAKVICCSSAFPYYPPPYSYHCYPVSECEPSCTVM